MTAGLRTCPAGAGSIGLPTRRAVAYGPRPARRRHPCGDGEAGEGGTDGGRTWATSGWATASVWAAGEPADGYGEDGEGDSAGGGRVSGTAKKKGEKRGYSAITQQPTGLRVAGTPFGLLPPLPPQ